MTHHQETKFVCDRCHTELYIATQNNPRPVFPQHWMVLWINSTDVQRHLCPTCIPLFNALMEGLPKV
jgi:hypothetical protein